jgi:hypothetical protein
MKRAWPSPGRWRRGRQTKVLVGVRRAGCAPGAVSTFGAGKRGSVGTAHTAAARHRPVRVVVVAVASALR